MITIEQVTAILFLLMILAGCIWLILAFSRDVRDNWKEDR